MKVCPTNVIQPALTEGGMAGLWTPVLRMTLGYCEYTCTLCGSVCPTGAIECIEDNEKREIRLCGTVLNRLPVIRCASCGGAFVPDRYLEYVTSRSDQVMEKSVFRKLCPKCARAKRAELFVKL